MSMLRRRPHAVARPTFANGDVATVGRQSFGRAFNGSRLLLFCFAVTRIERLSGCLDEDGEPGSASVPSRWIHLPTYHCSDKRNCDNWIVRHRLLPTDSSPSGKVSRASVGSVDNISILLAYVKGRPTRMVVESATAVWLVVGHIFHQALSGIHIDLDLRHHIPIQT